MRPIMECHKRRKRLVLHGIKKEVAKKIDTDISLPTKTHSKNGNGGLKPWVNADIILDLPSIEAGETYNGNLPVYNHTANNLSEVNKKKGYLLLEKAEEVEMLLPDELVFEVS